MLVNPPFPFLMTSELTSAASSSIKDGEERGGGGRRGEGRGGGGRIDEEMGDERRAGLYFIYYAPGKNKTLLHINIKCPVITLT